MNHWLIDWMNEWMNEINKWINQWMTEWGKLMNQSVIEWMNEMKLVFFLISRLIFYWSNRKSLRPSLKTTSSNHRRRVSACFTERLFGQNKLTERLWVERTGRTPPLFYKHTDNHHVTVQFCGLMETFCQLTPSYHYCVRFLNIWAQFGREHVNQLLWKQILC